MIDPHLQHFSRAEFKNANGDWWDDMSPRLLVMLDVIRFMLGAVIVISPNRYALGRLLGAGQESEHNVNYWGACLAADIFVRGVYTQEQAVRVVDMATRIGFTGIGVYADTTNDRGEDQVMFHLGVRSSEKMGDPALWGRVEGEYVLIEDALAALPKTREA